MAYLVPGLVLILAVSLTLEAFPSSGRQTDSTQEVRIRQLITALRKLQTSGHGLGATLERGEQREEAGKTEEIKEKAVLAGAVKEVDGDDLSTRASREHSLTEGDLGNERRNGDTGEDEGEVNVRSDKTDVSPVHKSAQTSKAAGRNEAGNGNRRGHGHGEDIDRDDVNPDSDLAKLLSQFELGVDGEKKTPKNLHKENLERVKGESHDHHPTPKPEIEELQTAEKSLTRRNFPKDNLIWPQGVVPYDIETGTFSQEQRAIIEAAIDEMRQKTCVDFQENSAVDFSTLGHTASVQFISSTEGCWSYVGKISNNDVQGIGLGAGCVNNPIILHEMCHAIGMEHEQSRTDRDKYVTMLWDNIEDGENDVNMKKLNTKDSNPYDYESILQYGIKNYYTGKYIMRFKDPELEFLADQATALTFYDIKDITASYQCTDKCGADVPVCQNGGFVDTTCGCLCPAGLDGDDCSNVITDTGCGGTIDVTSGPTTIESPNYPQDYDVEAQCAWVVKGPPGKLIQLTIESLSLSYNPNNERCYHWLEIRYNLMGQTGVKICANFTNEIYTSTWDGTPNIVYLMFDSYYADDKPPSSGFSLTAEAVLPGCASSPCVYGSCQEDPTAEFKCVCADQYEGVICDQIKASASFFCDFEIADTCVFINDDGSDVDTFDWTRHTGGTVSAGTGPSAAYGGDYYKYAEVSFRQTGEKAALLTSEPLPAGVWCLSFWYHLHGDHIGTFEVLGAADRTVWWSTSQDMGDNWNFAEMKISLSTKQKVELSATVNYWSGDVAIDNLQLHQCVSRCDFEDGSECFLEQSPDDDFDWIVDQSDTTPTSNTGPTSAQEGSRYGFIEASTPYASERAVLRSTSTYPAGEYCLTFCYHMYGKKMGDLEVSTLPESTDIENVVFLKRGDQGQQWINGVVSLHESEHFNLVFTGIRGSSYTSDIALDNITFTVDRCGCQSSPCLNGGTCHPSSTTQTGYQCSCPSGLSGAICENVAADTSLTCTFEKDAVCFLQQSWEDTADWTIRETPTATPYTGPPGAKEGEYFAYIETSGLVTSGDMAKLTTSPMSFMDGDRCLSFWYHMFGSSIGELSVCYGNTEVFRKQDSQGDTWKLAQVDIFMTGSTELIIAASVVQDRDLGDIAIDDVTLTPGTC